MKAAASVEVRPRYPVAASVAARGPSAGQRGMGVADKVCVDVPYCRLAADGKAAVGR
ncbi:hypothetical protein Srubr_29080 [Streptomyces rubradiris]|uniref:Uncharacterized protein n=1 Tax=Streptomyces rubradiris TaxID=285531 RepID=A0ABQ3RB27_STRRR|nr:hypothetical protein GCM10018792_51960 [Streptomyces rubradiris]GHI53062.1 hypothetical protein Srubr_29080 [Streptomyces rubradiris]